MNKWWRRTKPPLALPDTKWKFRWLISGSNPTLHRISTIGPLKDTNGAYQGKGTSVCGIHAFWRVPNVEERMYGTRCAACAGAMQVSPHAVGVPHNYNEREKTEPNAPGPGSDVERIFRSACTEWKRDTRIVSSATTILTHPSYLRIIGLGKAALPHIFHDLHEHDGHWHVALQSITGEDPTTPGMTMTQVRAAWLIWAYEHGYLTE